MLLLLRPLLSKRWVALSMCTLHPTGLSLYRMLLHHYLFNGATTQLVLCVPLPHLRHVSITHIQRKSMSTLPQSLLDTVGDQVSICLLLFLRLTTPVCTKGMATNIRMSRSLPQRHYKCLSHTGQKIACITLNTHWAL